MAEITVQEELLLCPTCKEQLDKNCRKFPCLCQPSYCMTCLKTLYEQYRLLKCPLCTKVVPGSNINTFPKDLTLLNLIEQAKGNSLKPRNENADLQAALANSIIDSHEDEIAKLDEHLCQLVIESSKKDDLLRNYEDEINAIISEKEKREIEIAVLKSKEKSRREADILKQEQLHLQMAMENSKRDVLLKDAQGMSEELNELFHPPGKNEKISLKNGNFFSEKEEELQIENISLISQLEEIKKTHDNITRHEQDVSSGSYNLDRANKSLQELNTLLKNEIRSYNMIPRTETTYSSQSHHTFRQPGPVYQQSFQHPHPPQLMYGHRNAAGFRPYTSPPYYGIPHYPPNLPPQARNYRPASYFGRIPRVPSSHPHPKDFRSNDGRNPAASEANKIQRKPNFQKSAKKHEPRVKPENKNETAKPNSDTIKKVGLWDHCLICAKVDHKTFECKFKGKSITCKYCCLDNHFESACIIKRLYELESSSSSKNLVNHSSDSDTAESSESEDETSHELPTSRSPRNDDADSKPTSSQYQKKNPANTDNLEKMIYPSKEEARRKNIDVNKPLGSVLLCLGKTSEGNPVSKNVQCLADIYAFEEKYVECKLIQF